jgi:hypothetical protein
VITSLPGDERAHALMGEYKTRQKEETEKAREARRTLIRQAFAQILSRHSDAGLFGEHTIRTEKRASTASAAILSNLKEQAPVFTIGSSTSPEPDVTGIVAKQEWGGGARICVVVIGQTALDETEIRYELLEYKVQVPIPVLSILINAPLEKTYIPLHPTKVGQLTEKMRAQIDDGLKSVTERIMGAIGG